MNEKINSSILDNNPELIKRLVADLIEIFFASANQEASNSVETGRDAIYDDFGAKELGNLSQLCALLESEIFGKAVYKCRTDYFKFVDIGDSSLNIVAAVVNALLNQNLTAHLTDSPGATFNEISLIRYVRKAVGFTNPVKVCSTLDIGGYFVSGGMMGNMAAMLIARNNLFPDAQQNGVLKSAKMIVPSFAAHYSTWNAMGWLGLGESNVVHVGTKNFCYDLEKLESKIIELKERGENILAVVASIGDPYSMSIDNIFEIREICDKYGIWLHGDGANCGILALSQKYKNCVKDIALCDSLTMDPHKSLGLNYPTSIFLCRDVDKFNTVVSHWNILNKKDSFDLGIITPFLNSRGFDSLKLWLLLKYFGTEGLAKIIDNKIDQTRALHGELKLLGDRIKIWNEQVTFSLLFQVIPDRLRGVDVCSRSQMIEIENAQNGFVEFLEKKTAIKLHSFKLPISLISGDDEKELVTVICLHNSHEKIPKKIINELKNAVNDFCKIKL